MMILEGSVVAKGLKGNGGDLMVISEDLLLSTAKTSVDMSGSVNGMAISNDGCKYYTGGDDKVDLIRQPHIIKIILACKSLGLRRWSCYSRWFGSFGSNFETSFIS